MTAKEFIDQILEEERQRWAFYKDNPNGLILKATPQLRTAESEV